MTVLPYCGAPPLPGSLLGRFNLDPVLICVLVVAMAAHLWALRGRPQIRFAVAGWLTVAAALLSPLCALSVALFSARIGQHMLLLLVAAPLLALALVPETPRAAAPVRLWFSGLLFLIALWFWHMPVPYQATFDSDTVYWLMHITLFGSGVLVWRELLTPDRNTTGERLIVAALTSMQMGLLGAVLTMAGHPLFIPHFLTTQVWGMTPLEDQQLGGVLMWVPGIALFLWASLRGLWELRNRADAMRNA